MVLAILTLIAAFAAPQVFKYLGGAQSDAARVQIEGLGSSVDLYRLDVGTYPPTLEALVSPPPGESRWDGPYLSKRVIPKDPWGNPFVYKTPGDNSPYDLISLGSDNALGGDGEAKDIVSWE